MPYNPTDPVSIIIAGFSARLDVVEGSTPVSPPQITTPAAINSDGTPQVGELLTGVDPTGTNGSVTARRWLLGSTMLTTAQTYTPNAIGTYRYEADFTGTDGSVLVSSSSLYVAGATVTPTPSPTYGNLVLSKPLINGVATSNINITGATSGSTISSNVPGLVVNSAGRTATFDGSAVAGSVSNGLVESGLAGYADKSNAVSVGAQGALSVSPSAPSVPTSSAQGALVATIAGVPSGVTPTFSPNDGRFVVAGDATNGWKIVVGLATLSAGSVSGTVAAQGAVSVALPITITAVSTVPQLVNPPVALIAGSVGRLSSYPYGSGTTGTGTANITQQWGGAMTPLQFIEPRITTTTYRINEPYQNAKTIGGLVYANDGAGFDTYETWIPRIKAASEAAIAAGTKLILIYYMTNNSYTLVNSATDYSAYTAQAKEQIQRLLSYGCIVIVAGCAPRGSQTVNPFTQVGPGAPRYAYKAINAEMKAYAEARPTTMGFYDQASVLLDNDNTPNDPLPGMMRPDQTHASTTGNYALAKLAKAAISRFLAPSATARSNRGTGSNLVPDFSSTSPTTVTGVTNASGIIPAGWKVTRFGGTDSTIVFDVVTVNGIVKLKWTTTGVATNEGFTLSPVTAPTLTAGTYYKGYIGVELSAYSRWNEFGVINMSDASNKNWGGNASVGNDGSPNALAPNTLPAEAISGGARTADGSANTSGAGTFTVNVGWGVGTGTVSGFLSEPAARAQIDPRFLTFDSSITTPIAITSSPTITMDELAIVPVQITTNKPAFLTVDSTAATAGINVGLTNGVLRGGSGVQSQPVTITATPYDFRDTATTQAATYNVTANPNVFSDNFNRADGPLGGSWIDGPAEGTGGSGFLISGQKLAAVTSGSDGILSKYAPQKGDTNRLRISYDRAISVSNVFTKLYIASDGTDQNGLYARHNVSNTITLTRIIAGTAPNVGTFATDNTTPGRFMIEVDGVRTVSAYQNGAKLGTITLDADIPANWKISNFRFNGGGITPIDNWSSTTSDQFAVKDKVILKNITAATTTYTVTQSAGLAVDLSNTTFGAALNIKTVTANTGDWNADGVTLRASNMPLGTYTVTVVLTESAPNAANTGAARDSTITLNVTVNAG